MPRNILWTPRLLTLPPVRENNFGEPFRSRVAAQNSWQSVLEGLRVLPVLGLIRSSSTRTGRSKSTPHENDGAMVTQGDLLTKETDIQWFEKFKFWNTPDDIGEAGFVFGN